jgi:hypothetical protein
MGQMEYSCYHTISIWIDTHFTYTIFLSTQLTMLVLIVYPKKLYDSAWPYGFHDEFGDGPINIRIRRIVLFILLEFTLIFTYIFAALVLRWILGIGSFTPLLFNCLIIEACYAPLIMEIVLYYVYRVLCYGEANVATVAFHAQFACMIRLLLFLFIRYAEFYPSSQLNTSKVRFFYFNCISSNCYATPSRFNHSELSLNHF